MPSPHEVKKARPSIMPTHAFYTHRPFPDLLLPTVGTNQEVSDAMQT
jgi:hypothetical protein